MCHVFTLILSFLVWPVLILSVFDLLFIFFSSFSFIHYPLFSFPVFSAFSFILSLIILISKDCIIVLLTAITIEMTSMMLEIGFWWWKRYFLYRKIFTNNSICSGCMKKYKVYRLTFCNIIQPYLQGRTKSHTCSLFSRVTYSIEVQYAKSELEWCEGFHPLFFLSLNFLYFFF